MYPCLRRPQDSGRSDSEERLLVVLGLSRRKPGAVMFEPVVSSWLLDCFLYFEALLSHYPFNHLLTPFGNPYTFSFLPKIFLQTLGFPVLSPARVVSGSVIEPGV
ncbi:hypothetical protein M7I_8111 [Glarea lozoyensis 74030]|uniref:Uncharacterized protein n=1 Tax=Glarea lozoyensis (strain ATCC 74030 / MF5533) TaxID=1104152 RepID=H0EZ49_GLAL7|nr:hypothetical protein M7I_8111 [Glarea lozoyensis 74030]